MDQQSFQLLLENLKDIKDNINELESEIKQLRKDVTMLKIKSGVVATLAATITSAIAYFANKS